MTTLKTKKGSVLPLINLKGKEYLMVAYRMQWLSEDVDNYTIETDLTLGQDSAVVKAAVVLLDKDGKVTRKAQATKRETLKDFPDYIEKAETGAIGRALAMLGFGTQHALSDLDEGSRLADSPLTPTKNAAVTPPSTAANAGSVPSPSTTLVAASPPAPRRSSSFKRTPKPEAPAAALPKATPPVINGATAVDSWD